LVVLDTILLNLIFKFILKILVVVKPAIADQAGHTEWFLSYYDIFVRNAFGSYRDILKQVSYNALMAENLSFLGSKSSAYMLERYRIQTSAGKIFAFKYICYYAQSPH